MKRTPILSLLVLLILSQLACNTLTSRLTSPTPAPVEDATPTRQAATAFPAATTIPAEAPTTAAITPAVEETPTGRISLETLRNFTYRLEVTQSEVPLQEGVFSGGEIDSQLVEPVAFGDLNGDGQEDAAVILRANTGGSGTFYELVGLLNQSGTPVQAGSAFIGDRQGINSLLIENGRIALDYLTQGPGAPLCCPDQRRLRSYLLENGALRLAGEQILDSPEALATPLPNAILIDQPADADPITSPLLVQGRISQAPPERKLVYYVTNSFDGTLLTQGEVPVMGEPGGPGTFSFEFSLEPGSTGLVQVEVVDSAGGILRGRSVVLLIAQP